jgi:hypothetical protein
MPRKPVDKAAEDAKALALANFERAAKDMNEANEASRRAVQAAASADRASRVAQDKANETFADFRKASVEFARHF